jgi:hypothetical protein
MVIFTEKEKKNVQRWTWAAVCRALQGSRFISTSLTSPPLLRYFVKALLCMRMVLNSKKKKILKSPQTWEQNGPY